MVEPLTKEEFLQFKQIDRTEKIIHKLSYQSLEKKLFLASVGILNMMSIAAISYKVGKYYEQYSAGEAPSIDIPTLLAGVALASGFILFYQNLRKVIDIGKKLEVYKKDIDYYNKKYGIIPSKFEERTF